MTHIVRLETGALGSEWLEEARHALVSLKEKTCVGAEFTAWYDWPERQGFALVKRCQEWHSQFVLPYDLVLVIGIGGSFAGTRAVDEALKHSYQAFVDSSTLAPGPVPIVYAGHNLSEPQLVELFDLLHNRQVVLNVISKSGTTLEPSVAFRVLRQFMERRYGKEEAAQRIVVTTDAKTGVLRKLADECGYSSFEIPPDVGGRYSVLTAVGLVPLTLAGHACEDLMEGAHALFVSLQDVDADHPVLKLAAARRAAWELGKKIDILSIAEPKLLAFVEWWKQLFGESEGKKEKGLFPTGMLYSTDLHSLGQYLQEGPLTMLQTFLYIDDERSVDAFGVERRLKVPHSEGLPDGLNYLEGKPISEISTAALDAAKHAHSARGVPCLSLHVARLDAFHLGYLTAFFETVCALSAAILGVNPFDQPGVEEYKKKMLALLGK